MSGFLYGQTEYNLLRNSLRISDYVKTASDYGYEYLSITDFNLCGHYKFYFECKKYNIKPIIGLEVFIDDLIILLYTKNAIGYENLLYISTLIQEKSVLTIDSLVKYSQGLFYVFVDYNFKDLEYCNEILDKFNKNEMEYYIGLSNIKDEHNIELYNTYDKQLFVPIARTRYLNKEDKIVLEALLKIGENKEQIVSDSYVLNKKELEERIYDKNIFNNLDVLVNKINFEMEHRNIKLPIYPNATNSKTYLSDLTNKGLKKRLDDDKIKNSDIYYKRLEHELSIIDNMGFNDYFLIVWDFVRYAKKNGIMVGPGRGSAAGSLVSFCLGITSIDPIKYDLLFERFLNPERVSMPDIDMDFPDDKRDNVIEYVKNLYGTEHVCNISAYTTFQVKSSIRDLGRVLKIPTPRLDEIVKMASRAPDNEYLLEKFKDNEEIYNLLYIAKRLEGLPRHITTHAAGIILSNDSLKRIIPLQPGLNGLYQSQLEASDLEKMGLLKIDFLGIRNLAIIDNIIKDIPRYNNINIYKIPLDDKRTYELLSNADTLGIFQLESDGMKKVLKRLKPNCFEDIVAVLALYRPGPMDNIDEYIERKNGKPFSYIHEDLEEILKSTYGIIVYQEQIMKIALKFASYSLGEADILRRAVSKKQESILISERNKFVKRSMEHGYSYDVANNIYDYIVKFANYGFNRSHSVAYSLVSYYMAYFKVNYFDIFMAKILNNVIGSPSLIKEYIIYARQRGINILPPNINYSNSLFVTTKKGLLFPFTGISSVGHVISNEIIKNRQNELYVSLDDFKEKNKGFNNRALESLIYSGAFDIFNDTKKNMIERVDSKIDIIDKFLEDRILSLDEFDYNVLKREEYRVLGINIKYNNFVNINKLMYQYNTKLLSQNNNKNSFFKVIVEFEELKEIMTKNRELMALGSLTDGFSSINFVIFPSSYANITQKFEYDVLYIAEGKITINNFKNEPQFQINKVSKI